MFEIFSLEIPFEMYDINDHMMHVVKGNIRPKIPNSWPGYLKNLLISGWSPNIKDRPTFQRIKSVIKTDMNLRAEENDSMTSRSTFMLNKSARSLHGSFGRKGSKHSHASMDRSERG